MYALLVVDLQLSELLFVFLAAGCGHVAADLRRRRL